MDEGALQNCLADINNESIIEKARAHDCSGCVRCSVIGALRNTNAGLRTYKLRIEALSFEFSLARVVSN